MNSGLQDKSKRIKLVVALRPYQVLLRLVHS